MTVQNTTPEVTFVGTGVLTSFAFVFRVDDITWLSVDFVANFDQFLLNSDQEIAPGGSVEYLVAPPNLQELTVTRTTPKEQLVDYTRYDAFDSESHEFALDKLTMLIQDTCATFDGHILDLDIHFSDAPADGVYYSRRNNAWEEPPFALPSDHLLLINIGVNTHADIDTHIANIAIHFGDAPATGDNYARNNNAWVVSPPATNDHLLLSNIGVNTHAQIDTHVADPLVHFLEASIDHAAIQNIGINTHAGIDLHIAIGGIHFTVASIDHALIMNIGANSHAAIDGHIGTVNIHFGDAPADSQDYVRNNNAWVTQAPSGFQGYGIWNYRTSTTSTPGSGRLQFDNAVIGLSTEMYLHEVNDGGTDMTAFLDLLVTDDLLYIQVQDDSSQFIVMQMGTPTKLGSVYTFPILVIEGQGSPLNNNTAVAVVSTGSGADLNDHDNLLNNGGGGSHAALALRTRGITIENPTAADNITLFFTDVAITIQQLNYVLRGATNVTAFLRFGPDRSLAGTNVINAGTVVANTTVGQEFIVFDNAAIPAGNWVWIVTTALTGTPLELNASLVYS